MATLGIKEVRSRGIGLREQCRSRSARLCQYSARSSLPQGQFRSKGRIGYTLREGANMLAEKYLERRFNEGKAEARRKAEVLLDIRRAAERGNLTQEDVERILSVLSLESGVVITKSPNGG